MATKLSPYDRRARRVRSSLKRVAGNRVRLSVFLSGQHTYAQLIDDAKGVTLAAASTAEKDLSGKMKSCANVDAAKAIGKAIAERALKVDVKDVVFDRGGRLYHGRVKALADAAREAGLNF